MLYDLFISYSRRDNAQGRITQLVERIKTDFANFEGNNGRELVPFFDQQEIHGMSDWRQRILQGLRESRLLLACLSPAYLQSEYCEWESVEYLKYEIGHLHGFNGVAPIYFVEVPGWDSKEFEQQCTAWVAELRKRQHFTCCHARYSAGPRSTPPATSSLIWRFAGRYGVTIRSHQPESKFGIQTPDFSPSDSRHPRPKAEWNACRRAWSRA